MPVVGRHNTIISAEIHIDFELDNPPADPARCCTSQVFADILWHFPRRHNNIKIINICDSGVKVYENILM